MAKFTNLPTAVNRISDCKIMGLPDTINIMCICEVTIEERDSNGNTLSKKHETKYLDNNGIAYPIDLIDNNYN